MTYQVLARKWRPKNFTSMVGQEHVLQALTNSLDQQKLHHAYLFSGTRGVGKTTVARILAKCLNCEKGISSQPCEQCDNCTAVNHGNFVDLIEVDAASRTKVEDTRDLLDNVQYAPTVGRFKVYLIDEVHMLSNHSFNALLKTLEEPPEHVKFLLATTDPQKLPVTILSRCLQFHLKNLLPELITTQLEKILVAEKVTFTKPALLAIAESANGSLRDALSLLDQAIAYSAGNVNEDNIHALLGTLPNHLVVEILEALIANDAQQILNLSDKIASLNLDFTQALKNLSSHLHHLAIIQAIPDNSDYQHLAKFAKDIDGSTIQLFYQMTLLGIKDIALAPNPKMGFEMTMLRMLAFQPATVVSKPVVETVEKKNFEQPIESKTTTETTAVKTVAAPAVTKPIVIQSNKEWLQIIPKLQLSGVLKMLIENCQFSQFENSILKLELSSEHSTLLNSKQKQRLENYLSDFFQRKIDLHIDITTHTEENPIQTPANLKLLQTESNLKKATEALKTDESLQSLLENFSATVDNTSIVNTIDEE